MQKVLLVDDDPGITEVVQIILSSNGYAVYTHSTGFNVPELVKSYDPDLILLDINLPGKQGTQICKELKAISNLPPILFFSAHASETEANSICKADGFIPKPFDVNKFIEIVRLHMN